ncbi:MAG TPA: hypothetical protein DDW65_13045 [Firmicutes bacterium]|jgi:hypothetical protein|nr:hypothetical protein [Bacillota bacterium]
MAKIRSLYYILILTLGLTLCIHDVSWGVTFGSGTLIRIGVQGRRVTEIQSYLKQLNYLRQKPSGFYGRDTAEAVKSFQLEHGLTADGIVGPETMTGFRVAMNADKKIELKKMVPGSDEVMTQFASRGRVNGVKAIPWSIVNNLWQDGETALIIDVETGQSFRARRLYGYLHADVEPLTKEDTETMLAVYDGKWSWKRRAVVVCLRNFLIAASINGMPHGQKSIVGNDFPGQFCVHFLGSRVHQSGIVDPVHLTMIEKAAACDYFNLFSKLRPQVLIPAKPVGSMDANHLMH